jgi:phage baseplate assembly protein W
MARTIDWFGFNFPFLTETSVLQPQSDLRIIKNDLLQLLLTSPGERVMRPDFGTVIRKTPFEPSDRDTINGIRSSVFQAVKRFEQRVIAKDVIVVPDLGNTKFTVTIITSLTRNPQTELSVTATFGITSQAQAV